MQAGGDPVGHAGVHHRRMQDDPKRGHGKKWSNNLRPPTPPCEGSKLERNHFLNRIRTARVAVEGCEDEQPEIKNQKSLEEAEQRKQQRREKKGAAKSQHHKKKTKLRSPI